jgi:hypothetical protein
VKAAWHWSGDSSVVHDSLEEAVRNTPYVSLPSSWDYIEAYCRFPASFVAELGNPRDTNE